MQTAQREFEHTAYLAAGFDRQSEHADRARLRLALAVAGLAGLVAWGVLDYTSSAPSADSRVITSSDEARVDGRGKWTGYTSR